MADMMDKVGGIMITQNRLLKEQNQDIKDIKNLLENKPLEPIEEQAEELEDEPLPDLFSLRRSPLYQLKIN